MKNNKKPKFQITSSLNNITTSNLKNVIDEIERNYRKYGKPLIVNLSDIKPNPLQPRKFFSDAKIQELGNSIRANGLIQPIVVRKEKNGGYLLISGERRYRACKLINLKEIPVLLIDASDEKVQELAIIENVQRENLTLIEEARAYKEIMHLQNLTQDQLAQKLFKSRAHIANLLRILNFPQDVQKIIDENDIKLGHLKVILAEKDPEFQKFIIEKIIKEKVSVRSLEGIVANRKNNKSKTLETIKPKEESSNIKIYKNKIVIFTKTKEEQKKYITLLKK